MDSAASFHPLQPFLKQCLEIPLHKVSFLLQDPSGEHPLPSSGMGRWSPRVKGGQGTASPHLSSRLSLQLTPPSMRFQQRGFCPCPPGQHSSGQNAAMEQKSPREEPRVQGSVDTAQALGQSPAAGASRRYGKNKESLPAITGFSNMANHAIFTGAYLFSEDAGTDSRVSFFSPAVFKDRFELALFKGFASCPLFLTPCTSLCVPPLLKTKQTPEKTQQQQKKHQTHTPTALRTQTYKGPLGSRKQSSFQAILLKP